MKVLALWLLVSTGCSGGVATFVVVHDTGDAGASSVPLADEHPDAAQGAGDGGAVVQTGEDAQVSPPDAYVAPEQDAGSDAFPDGSITVVTPPPDHTGMVQACCPQSSAWGCQYIVIGPSSVDKAIAPGACEWVPKSDAGAVYPNPDPSSVANCGSCLTGTPCLKADGVSCGCSFAGTCH